jgi:hypothetical protein
LLAVLGPNGSGKSSLVLAGLAPTLQAKVPDLQLIVLTPGTDPAARLSAALAPLARAATARVLLVVDQFEELFTLCTNSALRTTFLDRLLALPQQMPLVITMRADFLGDCALYQAAREWIDGQRDENLLAHPYFYPRVIFIPLRLR